MQYDFNILKYPRTHHLEGSRLQAGDEDLSQVPFTRIFGRNIVIEEKIDGANTALSFDDNGNLLLQSRGHYLTGGYRERHYNLFKQWANLNAELFYLVLGSRYIMYGEWMYAKHTVFYDALPAYFMEFDIFDRKERVFLSTPERRRLTDEMGIISSVPVLDSGVFQKKKAILDYIGPSNYITDQKSDVLAMLARRQGLSAEQILSETDPTNTMEGLYIKVEENGIVTERMKYVRASFLQRMLQSDSHWIDRPIIPNQLKGHTVLS